jgi:hypothetical protein
VISSSVSIFPSYALEVMGVPQDQSAQYVVDQLHDVEVFKAERSATVKFKKHEHVCPLLSLLFVSHSHSASCSSADRWLVACVPYVVLKLMENV